MPSITASVCISSIPVTIRMPWITVAVCMPSTAVAVHMTCIAVGVHKPSIAGSRYGLYNGESLYA